jgi:hypothetical protein
VRSGNRFTTWQLEACGEIWACPNLTPVCHRVLFDGTKFTGKLSDPGPGPLQSSPGDSESAPGPAAAAAALQVCNQCSGKAGGVAAMP